MGLFDFLKKKPPQAPASQPIKGTPTNNIEDGKKQTFGFYMDEIRNLEDRCRSNGIDFELMATAYGVPIPYSFEDYCANFSYYNDAYLLDLPRLSAAIELEIHSKEISGIGSSHGKKINPNIQQGANSKEPAAQANFKPNSSGNKSNYGYTPNPINYASNPIDEIYRGYNGLINDGRLAEYMRKTNEEYAQLEECLEKTGFLESLEPEDSHEPSRHKR